MLENTQLKYIKLEGVRVHNLKNINLEIPHNNLIVITGLSGSGKSTLAFDTIFAEGQRRYVESLSSYARQFLGRMNKPDVDMISGIPPAIAIEQKVSTRNPRSTVGTSTEIYDYMKLLYARIGRTFSPVSGCEVKSHSVSDVVNYILDFPEQTQMLVLAPFVNKNYSGLAEWLTNLVEQGFSRVTVDGKVMQISSVLPEIDKLNKKTFCLLIDRITVADDSESLARFGDSVQTAFHEGDGECIISTYSTENKKQTTKIFSSRFEADGIIFEHPNEYLFSFNNPIGACPHCEGYGKTIGIDENLVVPNQTLSVFEDAIACWRGEVLKKYKEDLIFSASKFNFPIHRPYCDLTKAERDLLWRGNKYFCGINDFFRILEEQKYKIQNRVLIARYTGKTVCPECEGSRLRKEAGYVKINGKNISELVIQPVEKLKYFFDNIKLTDYEKTIASRTLIEIKNRLQYLLDVGLGYLTLNRLSNSLSGGESQRINLATSLGSNLTGSLYILDEPSIGLHSRDTQQLVKVMKQLRDLGNTVIVVEHEEEIIKAADQIIDVGPFAGRFGGEIIFQGKPENANDEQIEKSLTLSYLFGKKKIETPQIRRKLNNYIKLLGVAENNLKNIDVRFPLGGIVAVTGVSGSGKSSLVKNVLYPALFRKLNSCGDKPGVHRAIEGDLRFIKNVELVDQNPIGKSSRSNPVTYVKVYDEIRKLYSGLPLAKANGYQSSHFSFNIDGGRCEECNGDGFIRIEMQFMSDIILECEACGGKRFKSEILEVKYKNLSISDLLDYTVDQAIEFFARQKEAMAKKICDKLKPLQDVGLGYIKLGQSSNTLSGGESQRVKLAYFLSKETGAEPTLFILDEPTTGLHFHDIKKLMSALNALVEKGHSIIIVEHNLDVIKSADWVIELGLDGGEQGGNLCFEGTPEELAKRNDLYTGKYLKEKL
ncbi:MAG: excinuclease ABC subunit UvrA [Prevotellaceae bacterium]|jgi:excinuclease ABC subunit A|nr:excinuclease ABC subunit UvrA [Prevotellaceae bacterium]